MFERKFVQVFIAVVCGGCPLFVQAQAKGSLLNPSSLTFALQKLENQDAILYSFAKTEKLTIVFFWASWCSFCIEAAKVIRPIYLQNKERMEIVGINTDSEKQKGKEAAGRYRFISQHYWLPKEKDSPLPLVKLPVVALLLKGGTIDTIYEGSQADKMDYLRKRLREHLEAGHGG